MPNFMPVGPAALYVGTNMLKSGYIGVLFLPCFFRKTETLSMFAPIILSLL